MRTTEGTKRDAVQTGITENACALTPMKLLSYVRSAQSSSQL